MKESVIQKMVEASNITVYIQIQIRIQKARIHVVMPTALRGRRLECCELLECETGGATAEA